MTTIAWDGTTLAADAASWSGNARRRVLKVHRITHCDRGELLVGQSGAASYAQLVLDWLKGGEKPVPTAYFPVGDLDRVCVVVIDRQKRVWEIGRDLVWSEVLEVFYATGAGHEFAWGALEMGATSHQAVAIAMRRSDMAGIGIDAVSFSDGVELKP